VPTNVAVDGGTNGLSLDPKLFEAILKKLPPAQAQLVRAQLTPAANVNLAQWPTLTFVLQGSTAISAPTSPSTGTGRSTPSRSATPIAACGAAATRGQSWACRR
jgi:hypothetical protein